MAIVAATLPREPKTGRRPIEVGWTFDDVLGVARAGRDEAGRARDRGTRASSRGLARGAGTRSGVSRMKGGLLGVENICMGWLAGWLAGCVIALDLVRCRRLSISHHSMRMRDVNNYNDVHLVMSSPTSMGTGGLLRSTAPPL